MSLGLALSGLVILPVSAFLVELLFGWDSARTPTGAVIPAGEAVFRLAIITGYLALALLVVASIAFTLGTSTPTPRWGPSAARCCW